MGKPVQYNNHTRIETFCTVPDMRLHLLNILH
uniref:Uncharacterized protein n=1 Tax=Lepeophtheirus salmonis TaxID=72036 RepID=A0A0K2TJP6_LEPSM